VKAREQAAFIADIKLVVLKSYAPQESRLFLWEPVKTPRTIVMFVASRMREHSARYLDAGNPLELSTPMHTWKHDAGQENTWVWEKLERLGNPQVNT
jgi:hypothetical protein